MKQTVSFVIQRDCSHCEAIIFDVPEKSSPSWAPDVYESIGNRMRVILVQAIKDGCSKCPTTHT